MVSNLIIKRFCVVFRQDYHREASENMLMKGLSAFQVVKFAIPSRPLPSVVAKRKNARSAVMNAKNSIAVCDVTTGETQSSNSSTNLLERLRERAITREAEDRARAAADVQTAATEDRSRRLKSLLEVCHALRSLFLFRQKSSLPVSECYNKIAAETRCSLESAKASVGLLLTVVPEFVSIEDADDILPYSTLKVDTLRPYKDVRETVLQFVKMSISTT